ncbi:MAG: prephenate dehydratase domain-containing protein [Caulobacteraceae bacterium]
MPQQIAFQGVFGAFSHEACQACLPDGQPTPFETFADAIAAVKEGRCDRAFLPVENSSAGPVPEMQLLLPECGLETIGEHAWRIRMQLMAVPGAKIADIKTVTSHPMALKQCIRVIMELGAQAVSAFDTAGAAEALAKSGDKTTAVVAARAAAELYGLQILRADVEDADDNSTRFVVLKRPAA